MNKKKWKVLYIARLINSGIAMQEAVEIYKSGLEEHEYNDDPISQADDLISYMRADS